MWMSVIPVFILCSFLCFHPAVLYVTFIDFFDKLPCTKPVIDDVLRKCFNSSFPVPINGSRINVICRYCDGLSTAKFDRTVYVSSADRIRL